MFFELFIPGFFIACIYFNRSDEQGEQIEEGRRYPGDNLNINT